MANNIRELRLARGWSMRELGEKMGIHFTTVAKIERSQRKLGTEWKLRFANALEVEPSEISDGGETGLALVREVPRIGLVAAGSWKEAILEPDGHAYTTRRGANVFALQVDGESMNKVIPSGGTVIVDPDDRELHEGGRYVVMNAEGETTFKQYRSSPARLEPLSDADGYEPILLGQAPFTVIGRAVAFTADL